MNLFILKLWFFEINLKKTQPNPPFFPEKKNLSYLSLSFLHSERVHDRIYDPSIFKKAEESMLNSHANKMQIWHLTS